MLKRAIAIGALLFPSMLVADSYDIASFDSTSSFASTSFDFNAAPAASTGDSLYEPKLKIGPWIVID